MANVSVYNMEGKDPLRSQRRRKKALETEGNRSCKTGFNKISSVETRRRGIRTRTQRLLIQT